MAAVIPITIALIVGVGLFAALTWFLITDEARHPVRIRETAIRTDRRHLSHSRIAAICLVFALWSLWATARPVSGWR
jgi:hypothetical protein